MIQENSLVELKTNDATYSPCRVVAISKTNITVKYSCGSKRDRSTGEFRVDQKTETIPMKNVVSLQERG